MSRFPRNGPAKNQPIWKRLNEWITAERFAHAGADGWFDAVMYYAYKDLRVEQSWTLWQRAKAEWQRTHPANWPTFDQWKTQTVATRALAQAGTEKARAVAAMENVHSDRLRSAVKEVVERRAVILWADCLSKPNQPVDPIVFAEMEKRFPAPTDTNRAAVAWHAPTLSRLIRQVESEWRETARREGWYAALLSMANSKLAYNPAD